eukprot:XP_001698050.1 predicted protein [Chlamydomonas reinhardtii]
MDLLGGYGSDGDGSGSDSERSAPPAPSSVRKHAPATVSVLGSMPPPKTVPSRTPATNAAGEDFFSSLPRPGGASGLSSLPPPSSSSLGGGGAEGRTAGGKKVIMLPLQRQLLAAAALDSDDEEEPAAKRFKAGAGGKSKLMDFLPPPKNDTGPITGTLGGGLSRSSKASGAGAGAAGAFGSAGPGPSSAAAAADAVSGAGSGGASAALPSDFFAGNEAAAYSNEAFRVAENEGPAPYGGYDPSGAGGGYSGKHAASALAAGVDEGASADLLEEALKAEQERAAKRGGGGKAGMFGPGVKVVEVKAKDLTAMDPAAREAAKTAQDALGSEYAMALRRSAAPFEGNKLAKRKHQIGTLLFNARMQELDQMEKRTVGQKSKAETAAKYGAVDFALLFVANYEGVKGGLAAPVLEALAAKLPPSVWLLMAGSNAAYHLLDGLLEWMQRDDGARPVIAGGVSSGRGDLDDDSDAGDDGGELVIVSGGVAAGARGSLHELLRRVVAETHSVPYLALWRAGRGDKSVSQGLDAFTGGRLVLGQVEPQLLALYGVGCRLHLRAELPVLRSVCSAYPLLPGGRPDPRSWAGCTGRGRAIFGEANAENEARIADERGVPFLGGYMNGELGPYVRHGYAGWFFNPLCVQPPGSGASGASAGSHGAAVGVVAGGRVLPLDRTQMQGYTSVYAALG